MAPWFPCSAASLLPGFMAPRKWPHSCLEIGHPISHSTRVARRWGRQRQNSSLPPKSARSMVPARPVEPYPRRLRAECLAWSVFTDFECLWTPDPSAHPGHTPGPRAAPIFLNSNPSGPSWGRPTRLAQTPARPTALVSRAWGASLPSLAPLMTRKTKSHATVALPCQPTVGPHANRTLSPTCLCASAHDASTPLQQGLALETAPWQNTPPRHGNPRKHLSAILGCPSWLPRRANRRSCTLRSRQ